MLLEVLGRPEPEQAAALQRAAASAPECANELRLRFELFRRFEQVGPTAEAMPRNFGEFELLRELGRGGMGIVYLASQQRGEQQRLVALKVLATGTIDSPQARQRLRREGAAVFRLVHPGICQVLDVGEVDGIPFLAMGYVPGSTLAEHIARARAAELPLELPGTSSDGDPGEPGQPHGERRTRLTLRLVEQAARALHVAHEAGLVHRDVKPANLMVTPDGEPVLLDFGLVRDEAVGDGLTLTGQSLGTPTYMSPEQIDHSGPSIDRTTDVYSLGATLYEALTLEPPFRAPTRAALFQRILNGHPPDLRRATPPVARDLRIVVETAMARDRARRYATALDFAEDLRRVRCNQPIAARPPTPGQRLRLWCRRNPLAAGLFVLLTAALAGNGWLAIRAGQRATQAQRAEALAEADAESAQAAIDALVDTARRHLTDVPWLEQARAELLGQALEFQRDLLDRHDRALDQQVRRAILQVQYGMTLAGLGDREAAGRQLEQAMQVLGSAVDTGQNEARRWLAKAQLTRAQLARAAGDEERSFRSASEAVEQLTRLLATRPPTAWDLVTLASARRQLAERLLATDRHAEAEAQIDSALRLTRDSTDDDIQIEHALVVGLRAQWHEAQRRTPAAIADCSAAIERLRTVLARHPYDRSLRSNLAEQLSMLGGLYRDRVDLDLGLTAFEEGRALLEGLVATFPQVSAYRANLATLLNRQAITLRRLGRKEQAQALLEHALLLCEALASEPGDTASRRAALAAVQHNLANGLKSTDRLRAVRLFRQALASVEELLQRQPDDATLLDAAMGYASSLGATLAEAESDGEAMAAFAASRRHAARLLDRGEAGPGLLRNHALLSGNEGTLAAELGDLAAARARLLEAVELGRRLVALAPADPRAHAQLRRNRVRLAMVVELAEGAAALPHWQETVADLDALPADVARRLADDDQAGFDAVLAHRGLAACLLAGADLAGADRALARARTRAFAPEANLAVGVESFLLHTLTASLAEQQGDQDLAQAELEHACRLARTLAEPIQRSRLHCRRVLAVLPAVQALAATRGISDRAALATLAQMARTRLD